KLTTLNIFDRPGFSAIIFWAVFGAVMQAEACEPASGNEYEKVFCQLKRSGRGEELPSIHDFRKNPPLMQALLLKKPAERAGIPLRIPERGNAETVDRQADLLLAPMVEPTLEPPKDQKLLPAKTVPAPQVVHK